MSNENVALTRVGKLELVDHCIGEMAQSGLALNQCDALDGPEWTIDGAPLKNFGTCSYMGIERHPAIVAGAERALHEFGAQVSISRVYMQLPLYRKLEEKLGEVTGGSVIVAPSTTMAHLSALPVLVGAQDVVLIDQFAHASLHMATQLLDDVPVEVVRHSRIDALESLIARHGTAQRIWYLCDGVYSMLGDFAPFAELRALQTKYPKLHLYVDDAHGMSWAGKYGRGVALDALPERERVVVALSLSKAFGANGGAVVLPSDEQRDRVRRCGATLLFSGPMAPASLGASLASAELHVTPAFARMQQELHDRIVHTRKAIASHGLTIAAPHDLSPIMMVQLNSSEAVIQIAQELRARGYYTCVAVFPAVPKNRPSIRFTLNRHNSIADIDGLIENLAELARPWGQVTVEPLA